MPSLPVLASGEGKCHFRFGTPCDKSKQQPEHPQSEEKSSCDLPLCGYNWGMQASCWNCGVVAMCHSHQA
eukprot:1014194-Amphidinium_carterae.1